MSLYNLINGVKPATFFVLPMLGKHPDEYPRFRDCLLSDEEHPEYDDHIHVYTRAGGGNREAYSDEIEQLRAMPTFVADFDDSFDNTYATFVFAVPKQWQADFDKVKAGRVTEVSDAYQAELVRVYPKLESEFAKLFDAEAAQ